MASEHYLNEETEPLMVSVIAPASLPAGYTFEALVNDDPTRTFLCEVPEGGVEAGDRFLTPLPAGYPGKRIRAPVGHWKDGLFDCFRPGICHPSWICAFFCSKISMAQIMTRMSLTWLGEPGDRTATKGTFKVVVLLFVAYLVFSVSMRLATADYGPSQTPIWLTLLNFFGATFFGLWSLYSLCRTRQNVRRQYSIPEERCHGCEDLCCAFFCTCCTLSQMARHTGEYETYPGVFCSTTGHPPGTPLTV